LYNGVKRIAWEEINPHEQQEGHCWAHSDSGSILVVVPTAEHVALAAVQTTPAEYAAPGDVHYCGPQISDSAVTNLQAGVGNLLSSVVLSIERMWVI
jgi:hypothetical protein